MRYGQVTHPSSAGRYEAQATVAVKRQAELAFTQAFKIATNEVTAPAGREREVVIEGAQHEALDAKFKPVVSLITAWI
ncbi:MAG: hypothetical protein EBV41_04520, partial [Actinobacteria bacterium]|nr:hypothetical protein [Actinomycetota bacterium]